MAHFISPEAEVELSDIWNYMAENSTIDRADSLLEAFAQQFLLLAEFPYLGRQREDLRHDYRSSLISDYVIIYQVDGKNVNIVKVVHGARDYSRAFNITTL